MNTILRKIRTLFSLMSAVALLFVAYVAYTKSHFEIVIVFTVSGLLWLASAIISFILDRKGI